jgi:hypothetical protein
MWGARLPFTSVSHLEMLIETIAPNASSLGNAHEWQELNLTNARVEWHLSRFGASKRWRLLEIGA